MVGLLFVSLAVPHVRACPYSFFSTSIVLCPDLDLKCATSWWEGLTTGCRFSWGFPLGIISLTVDNKNCHSKGHIALDLINRQLIQLESLL